MFCVRVDVSQISSVVDGSEFELDRQGAENNQVKEGNMFKQGTRSTCWM